MMGGRSLSVVMLAVGAGMAQGFAPCCPALARSARVVQTGVLQHLHIQTNRRPAFPYGERFSVRFLCILSRGCHFEALQAG